MECRGISLIHVERDAVTALILYRQGTHLSGKLTIHCPSFSSAYQGSSGKHVSRLGACTDLAMNSGRLDADAVFVP
jgi:hypothetical protein